MVNYKHKTLSFLYKHRGEVVFFLLLKELLEEYSLDCRIRNLSKRTIESYKFQLTAFGRYLKDDLCLNDVTAVKKVHIKKIPFKLARRREEGNLY